MPFLEPSPIRSSSYSFPTRRPAPIQSFPVQSKPAEVPVKTTWSDHVKRTREESGGTLKEVLKKAKETYKK